jgi:hypothetical protein
VRPNVDDKYEAAIRNQAEIPREWTCKPEQYGTADGCQCNCGAFDPDCNPFEAVSLDCPNHDDICIPGLLNKPFCALRHQVLSERKLLQIQSGVAVHHPQFYFSNDTDIDGAPWGNYSNTYTRSDVPATWRCNPLFYGSKDGCDCECGAWDPDCDTATSAVPSGSEASEQRVFNCDTYNNQVQCVMSKTTPSEPVCLYDRMASAAAVEAGYPYHPETSSTQISTTSIIAASVGSTIGAVIIVSVITYLIIHKRRVTQRIALLQPL